MIRTSRCLLGLAACAVMALRLAADITVQSPTGANLTPTSHCPAKDGSNSLQPCPPERVPPPSATGGIIEELRNGDTPYPGWSFTNGPALNGTLKIEYYHSKFAGAHHSGAQIKAVYTPATNDPPNLRWIQMITTTAPITNTLNGPYIDPYPDDDNRPFYYTEAEAAKYGLSFYDFCRRYHPPNSKVQWSAVLHLSSWNGQTPGSVTVHDGIRWGFRASCATNVAQKKPAIRKSGDKSVVVTYTAGGPEATLETAPSLESATLWEPVAGGIIESNGSCLYVVQDPQGQQFFRLSFEIEEASNVPIPAHIRVPPLPEQVEPGADATFFVKAAGTQPVYYQWFHNGEMLMDQTNAACTLAQVQPHQHGLYWVEVRNDAGVEMSEPVELLILPDTEPPRLLEALALTPIEVWAFFSEPLDPASAMDLMHYQITGPGAPVVMGAVLEPPGQVVRLIVQPPLEPGLPYTLIVNDVADLAGNLIQPDSSAIFSLH